MDVETLISELKCSLGSITSEEALLQAIAGRMPALRQSFRSQKSLFTPTHVCFLQSLAAVSDQLQRFIELKGNLADVVTIEDHAAMVSRLAAIKVRLRPFAIGKRVMKQLWELNQKLPAIRQQNEGKWRVRVNTGITDLEQHSPRCPSDHAMVIRQGPYDYFWGCSRFPFCGEAARLTPDQRRQLD